MSQKYPLYITYYVQFLIWKNSGYICIMVVLVKKKKKKKNVSYNTSNPRQI